MIRAFYDREIGSILGLFTLQEVNKDGILVAPFKRVLARSGQKRCANTSWERACSPIPFGQYRLWTHSFNRGTRAGTKGIGEFFPISSGDDPSLILNPSGKQKREHIGLHEENALPGSAGCIVVANYEQDFKRIAEYLHQLHNKGIKYISLTVL